MAFIPLPGHIKLVPEFTYVGAGTKAANVLYFAMAAPTETTQQLVDLMGLYQAWFTTHAAQYVSGGVSLTTLTAQYTSSNSPLQIVAPIVGSGGTQNSPAMPASVTFATSFKTDQAGRSYRGRAYWIGLGESQITDNHVIAATADGIRAAWQAMGENFGEELYVHKIVSFHSGGQPRSEGLATRVKYYVNTDTRVDTQRRRLV